MNPDLLDGGFRDPARDGDIGDLPADEVDEAEALYGRLSAAMYQATADQDLIRNDRLATLRRRALRRVLRRRTKKQRTK